MENYIMRFKVATFFTSLFILTIVGCGSPDSSTASSTGSTSGPTSEAKPKYRIAVIPKGATHEYWKAIHAGANQAAKELNVEIVWKAPEKEDDREGQIKVVEDMITEGVQGICLAPLDDTALAKPVLEAEKQNIPVVVMDSDLKNAEYSSFVATDNFKGGQMAGEYLGKLLNGKGNVVRIRYEEGSASTDKRENGFLDAIKKFPGIKVVSDNQYAGATTESAQKTGESVLSSLKNPDGSLSIQGLYTPNESSTFGLLRVLQDNKWAGKIKFVGFDSSAKLLDGLKAGEIDGLILQNPFKMGHDSVQAMFNVLEKKTVEKKEDTGATLATKANMDSDEVAKLLSPPNA